MNVEVKVLFFAKAREISEKQNALIHVPNEITCRDLLGKIVEEFSLHQIRHSVILAVNEDFCHLDDQLFLKQGDEIAIIPPLSGG